MDKEEHHGSLFWVRTRTSETKEVNLDLDTTRACVAAYMRPYCAHTSTLSLQLFAPEVPCPCGSLGASMEKVGGHPAPGRGLVPPALGPGSPPALPIRIAPDYRVAWGFIHASMSVDVHTCLHSFLQAFAPQASSPWPLGFLKCIHGGEGAASFRSSWSSLLVSSSWTSACSASSTSWASSCTWYQSSSS